MKKLLILAVVLLSFSTVMAGYVYDDFSGSTLNLTKWSLSKKTDYEFPDEYSIDTINGVYQIKESNNQHLVLEIIDHDFQSGDFLEYDIYYQSGSGNILSYIILNDIETYDYSQIGGIGWLNGDKYMGNDPGYYHMRLTFTSNGANIEVTRPDSSLFFGTLTGFTPPYKFALGTIAFGPATGEGGLLHFDYDNFIIKNIEESLPVDCVRSTATEKGTVYVYCSDGYIVTGGGCGLSNPHGSYIAASYPVVNGWFCQDSGGYTMTAYAICCRIEEIIPDHNHDDRYYTKPEVDSLIQSLQSLIDSIQNTITGILGRLTILENPPTTTTTSTTTTSTTTTTLPEKCWNGENRFLVKDYNQFKKFCKCVEGTYGYNSYVRESGTKWSGCYLDANDNGNWNMSNKNNYGPAKAVICKDGGWYYTSQDYYQ
ncbi:MAG: hypothetical protein ACTSWJ_05650 [Candidatus Heimdallarchaeaceae archaeon]